MSQPVPRGLITLANLDLEEFGFGYRGSNGNLFGKVGATFPTAKVVGAAGDMVISEDATLESPVVPLDVFFRGDSPAECQTALDDLAGWLSLGPVELWQKRRPTQVTLASWGGHSLFVPVREMGRSLLRGTITLKRSPYYVDRYPQRVVSNGNGWSNRVEIETGTAPMPLQIWVLDASNVTITQRDYQGNIVQQSTITMTLDVNDTGILEQARRRVLKIDNGTPADDPDALTLGHLMFTADPRWGVRSQQRWQTLEVNSGRIVVDVHRGWIA